MNERLPSLVDNLPRKPKVLSAGDEYSERQRLRLLNLELFRESYSVHIGRILGKLQEGLITQKQADDWVHTHCYRVLMRKSP